MAGTGSNVSKYEIQANQNASELSYFLKHVTNVNINDKQYFMKTLKTSALLDYCRDTFSKQNTAVR